MFRPSIINMVNKEIKYNVYSIDHLDLDMEFESAKGEKNNTNILFCDTQKGEHLKHHISTIFFFNWVKL